MRNALQEMVLIWKLLCFRFGIFVVFKFMIRRYSLTYHVNFTDLDTAFLIIFEVTAPISCCIVIFLYSSNFFISTQPTNI